jgi:uncharacterized protein YneF (UPF0154 family)
VEKAGGKNMTFWASLGWFALGAAVGALVAWFLSRRSFQKQLKENPPVNEKMIRAMFMSMGRKPSEAQIKQVMRAMNNAK